MRRLSFRKKSNPQVIIAIWLDQHNYIKKVGNPYGVPLPFKIGDKLNEWVLQNWARENELVQHNHPIQSMVRTREMVENIVNEARQSYVEDPKFREVIDTFELLLPATQTGPNVHANETAINDVILKISAWHGDDNTKLSYIELEDAPPELLQDIKYTMDKAVIYDKNKVIIDSEQDKITPKGIKTLDKLFSLLHRETLKDSLHEGHAMETSTSFVYPSGAVESEVLLALALGVAQRNSQELAYGAKLSDAKKKTMIKTGEKLMSGKLTPEQYVTKLEKALGVGKLNNIARNQIIQRVAFSHDKEKGIAQQ